MHLYQSFTPEPHCQWGTFDFPAPQMH